MLKLSSEADLARKGNPILECVRNVRKEFGDILADYQVGRTTGVLFLRYVELCLATIPRSKHTAVLAVYDTIDYTLNIFGGALSN